MQKYKIHRVFLNNFRNTPYNPELCNPALLDLKTIPKETRGLFILDDAKIIVLDGDNGYGKTTFFLSLEYVLLGKIAKEVVNKSDQRGDNKDSDFLRNQSSPKEDPYLVSILLSNGEDYKQITRISSDKASFLFLDNKEIQEQNLSELLMSDGINIHDFYKNYLYLPQDEVFGFLIKKDERGNLSKLLKPEKEEALLTLIYRRGEQKATSIIKGLEIQRDKLERKRGDILKKELKGEGMIDQVESTNTIYDKRLYGEELLAIELEQEPDEKMNALNILVTKTDTYKIIAEQRNFYLYETALERKRKFDELENFIGGVSFPDFLQSYKNRGKETDKFKNIDKQILDKQKELTLGRTMETSLENIQTNKISNFISYVKSNLIQKDIQVDYEQLSFYDSDRYIESSLMAIEVLIKEKREEMQRYGYLYTNIKYIFDNISQEGFKIIDISPGKREKFCPTCGSEFNDYSQLKDEVNNQLVYFEEKSKDTQIINIKIEELIASEKFQEVLGKIHKENQMLLGEKNRLVEIKENLENFNKNGYYSNSELTAFVMRIQDVEGIDLLEKIQLYKDKIQADINTYLVEDTTNFIGIKDYLNGFKLITGLEDISMQDIIKYNFLESKVINANNQYLRNEKLKFTNQKNELERVKKIMLIRYLDKRIEKLEKLEGYYNTLYDALDQHITKNINSKINGIKIPVYIFSKRILKHYIGDSIFLNYNESTRDINITSSNFKRSPYFQYSEGQLTAVMLSILLSLNISISKITNLNILLIDDPIQTLDDLNELSFVNLLRYQFPEKQIVISTHETDFSAYIRYKFWRLYGDGSHKNINMKNKTLLNK